MREFCFFLFRVGFLWGDTAIMVCILLTLSISMMIWIVKCSDHKSSCKNGILYDLGLYPLPGGKWRFVKIPNQKCDNPGDDCYPMFGQTTMGQRFDFSRGQHLEKVHGFFGEVNQPFWLCKALHFEFEWGVAKLEFRSLFFGGQFLGLGGFAQKEAAWKIWLTWLASWNCFEDYIDIHWHNSNQLCLGRDLRQVISITISLYRFERKGLAISLKRPPLKLR